MLGDKTVVASLETDQSLMSRRGTLHVCISYGRVLAYHSRMHKLRAIINTEGRKKDNVVRTFNAGFYCSR